LILLELSLAFLSAFFLNFLLSIFPKLPSLPWAKSLVLGNLFSCLGQALKRMQGKKENGGLVS